MSLEMVQASLRLSDNISAEERKRRVDKVIKDLALRADTIIGANGAGISGGERRRLTFAAELLTDPSLLFLDEPTSGLDSSMAADVLKQLHVLARGGRTVVCTVHQPDPRMY
jgi:ABC-type multidrug transport system ATPase subunit